MAERDFLESEVTVSQNYNHCVEVYKLMEREATHIKADTGVVMLVWEGFFTKLIVDRLQYSVPYFSTIRRELIRMGCIRQLRRGGGTSPSQWELLREPTEAAWHTAPAKPLQAATRQAQSEGQIVDLCRRLDRLEENFNTLMQVMSEGGTVTVNKGGK